LSKLGRDGSDAPAVAGSPGDGEPGDLAAQQLPSRRLAG